MSNSVYSIRQGRLRLHSNGVYALEFPDDGGTYDFNVCVISHNFLTIEAFITYVASCGCKPLLREFFMEKDGVVIKTNIFLYFPKTETFAIDLNYLLYFLIKPDSDQHLTSPYVFITARFTCIETKNTITSIIVPSYSPVAIFVDSPEFTREALLCGPEKLAGRICRYHAEYSLYE